LLSLVNINEEQLTDNVKSKLGCIQSHSFNIDLGVISNSLTDQVYSKKDLNPEEVATTK
jgi:hypothetical protein